MYSLPIHQQPRKSFSNVNAVLILILISGFIVIFSSGKSLFPFPVYRWDILLPFMIYFGQRRTWTEGIVLTVVSAHLYSLASSAPVGLFTIHYLLYFTLARLFSYVLYANRWYSILVLMLSFITLSRLSMAFMALVFGHGWPLKSPQNFNVWFLITNSVFGYFIYVALGLLDRLTGKLPRQNIELRRDRL